MNTNLFSCMPEKVKQKLVRKHYKAGSPLILSDYDNNYVFFLMHGYAEAYIQTPNGTMVYIYGYKQGNVFGEIEPFYTADLRPVSIKAITDCSVDVLHRNDFLEWLKNDFNAVTVLIAIISEKLVNNGLLVEEVSLMSVRERVLRCVSIYYYRNELYTLTKKQIALEANTPIRSVNRAIIQCCEQGIFCYKNKHIEVLNEKALSAYLPTYLHKNNS